jgi:hypothetical protein
MRWKPWMRFHESNPTESTENPKSPTTAFQSSGAANTIKSSLLTAPCVSCSLSDWVDSLIGPSGLLLVINLPPPCCNPSFSSYGWDWKKKLVTKTKTWM